MTESYRALCSDFYVNQKLSVKLELPRTRESVLDLFERIRREYPALDRFRRYKDELALESGGSTSPHRWVAVRSTNIRSGVVNPSDFEEAYGVHRQVLELSPFFLSISPLDVDAVELLFGFDLDCRGRHDRVIHEALYAGTSIGGLMDGFDASPIDCQPVVGYRMAREGGEFEAHFEVKSRATGAEREFSHPIEPISVYLTVRRGGPVKSIESLVRIHEELVGLGERLVDTCVTQRLLRPLREAIGSGAG